MKKERLYSLDILKFIGALLIAVWHLNQNVGVDVKYYTLIFEQLRLDNIVDLFFIISGFLCLYNYKKSSFDQYIKHKVKNLYPLAIISVLVCLILLVIYKLTFGQDWYGQSLGLWRVYNSLLLTTAGQATILDMGINNPLWYVSVLMVCYVAFYFATKNENLDTKYILLALCLFGLGIHEYKINLPFINGYIGRGFTGFFEGTIMCYLYEKYKDKVNKWWFIFIPLIVLTGIAGCLSYNYVYFMDNKWCIDVLIIMPLIVAIFICLNKYLVKCHKLSVLSNISYNIYVWHCSILIIYSMLSIGTCNIVEIIIYLLVCIIWAIISHILIEKNIYKLINKK